MVYRPRQSAVPGRGGKLREVEMKFQIRFRRGSKGGGGAICRAFADALEARGITVEDILVKETHFMEGGDTYQVWASWENGEVY